ncbi:unnamed protein product [Darwinula stevensoni]|uniref:UBC core domain-containing protein n=1 Tax=Darwinula stevensoni TaxID=69355 RepID=A0A7R9A1Y9_9CRUS|nr:unnamed protein product [Darwinula stevensoni]CAG0878575.1 unnamed protein product [Darwinula stevensoni]
MDDNPLRRKSPAVKRLMREAQELHQPTEDYFAQPMEDNLFEWHFTVRGPADTDFEQGIYHGRILLPPEYPMKPPSIIMLTPNGRFELNKKVCLSISGHHPESWQPSWSIRTALLAIIGFMPTHGLGAIGSLDYTPEERKLLAKKSREWKCPTCGPMTSHLLPRTAASRTSSMQQEISDIVSHLTFTEPKENKVAGDQDGEGQQEKADLVKNEEGTESSQASSQSSSQDSPPLVRQRQVERSIPPMQAEGQPSRARHNNNNNTLSNMLICLLSTAIICLMLRRIIMSVLPDFESTASQHL